MTLASPTRHSIVLFMCVPEYMYVQHMWRPGMSDPPKLASEEGGRHLPLLQRTQIWFPAARQCLTTICNSSSREEDNLSGLSGHLNAHGAYTLMQTNTF